MHLLNSYLSHNHLFSPVYTQIVAVHPHFVRSHFKQFVTGGKKVSSLSVKNYL